MKERLSLRDICRTYPKTIIGTSIVAIIGTILFLLPIKIVEAIAAIILIIVMITLVVAAIMVSVGEAD